MAIKLSRSQSIGALSITPLIDVVFLLLIFFLVAPRLGERERRLMLNLPQASSAKPTVFAGREVYVNLLRDGQFVVDDRRMNADELRELLLAAYAENPGRQKVTIRADEDARSGALVAAMDACAAARILNYTIATE